MRRLFNYALWVVAGTLLLVVALAIWALPQRLPEVPAIAGTTERGSLQHDGRKRTWVAYMPAHPAEHPALVLALHASMSSGEEVREVFGHDFDLLADREGFLVVYPQGFGGHWNDCKALGPYAAKREHIDDIGFLHALVDRLAHERNVDPQRVFVTGVSNGGSMALCLAMLTPEFARAYAAVVASIPTAANMVGTPKRQAVSIMLMNGTDDPVNPWRGGDVVLWPVLGNRGPVLSTPASIDYFRALAGLEDAPQVTQFADRDRSDASTVERALWSAPGKRQVALFTVRGGGHGAPHPETFGRRLLGNSNRDIHAANEIWEFFRSAP